jgi:hypothetical protein
VGVDGCKRIEETRCRLAPMCGISLEPPVHTSEGDVEACIRYYDVACLHGLAVADPGATAVNACVSAIQSHGCSAVMAPESDPACAFLAPASDAGADGPSSDSGTDAQHDGDAGDVANDVADAG